MVKVGGDFTSNVRKVQGVWAQSEFPADLVVNKPINRAFVGASGQKEIAVAGSRGSNTGPSLNLVDQQMKVEPSRIDARSTEPKTISAPDIEKPEEVAWDSAPEFTGIELAAGRRCLEAMRTSIPAPSNRERAIPSIFLESVECRKFPSRAFGLSE